MKIMVMSMTITTSVTIHTNAKNSATCAEETSLGMKQKMNVVFTHFPTSDTTKARKKIYVLVLEHKNNMATRLTTNA